MFRLIPALFLSVTILSPPAQAEREGWRGAASLETPAFRESSPARRPSFLGGLLPRGRAGMLLFGAPVMAALPAMRGRADAAAVVPPAALPESPMAAAPPPRSRYQCDEFPHRGTTACPAPRLEARVLSPQPEISR